MRRILTTGAIAALLALPIPITALAVAPPNDDRANATPVGALPYVDVQDTSDATPQDIDAPCGGGPTVWYTFTPATTGYYTAATWGSDYDTTLWVGDRAGEEWLGCNDDAGQGLQSKVTWRGRAGVEYLLMVGSWCDDCAGDLRFVLMTAPPPSKPPSFHLRVANTARLTWDGKVEVRGRTANCARATRGVEIYVRLRQFYGRRIIRADGGDGFRCGVAWKMRLGNADFRFARGRVRARVVAVVCNRGGCSEGVWRDLIQVR